ncbi:MAG: RDD family protein [Steroidobacterales bacterium]
MISGRNAGFGRRLAALLYDSLLLGALLMVFTAAVMLLTHGRAVLGETVGGWVYLYRAALAAVIAAYFILNWTHSGQTLGMRAWRLHVVGPDGKRLKLRSAALRFACASLAWAPAGLGVLWLYLDPQRLALHDRVSRTRIIHVARR